MYLSGMRTAFAKRPHDVNRVAVFYPNYYKGLLSTTWDLLLIEGWYVMNAPIACSTVCIYTLSTTHLRWRSTPCIEVIRSLRDSLYNSLLCTMMMYLIVLFCMA